MPRRPLDDAAELNGAPDRDELIRDAAAKRTASAEPLANDAGRVARACYDMAVRFHRGGRLVVFGSGGAATDAQHIAVEFVHPVVVGKRSSPAGRLPAGPVRGGAGASATTCARPWATG